MNAIWSDQGLTTLRSLIGSGDEVRITDFILSGSAKISELQEFSANEDSTITSFPNQIYRSNVENSYISEDGFLTVFCKIPKETTGAFYYNGIGIVLKDKNDNDILLGLSRLLTEQYCGGNEKNLWIKLPAFIENKKSVFNIPKTDSVNLNQLNDSIEKHNKDIASHPYILDLLGSVSDVVSLELFHKIVNAEFELFKPKWTLLNQGKYKVTSINTVDLTIELNTTNNLVPGHFVIFTESNQEEIEIKEIIDSHKVKVTKAPMGQYNKKAYIAKTSIKDFNKGEITAKPESIYISKEIKLKKKDEKQSIILRKTNKDAKLSLYIKMEGEQSFSLLPFKWVREINDVYADYEYEIPGNKNFIFKIINGSKELKINHIVCMGEPSGLGGVLTPPDKPVNKAPASGSLNIKETPTLEIVEYSHPLETAQKYIEFEISAKSDFSVITHDSGKLSPGTTYSVPENIINENTKYYWRARVEDVDGGTSEFSDAFSFTTEPDFEYIRTPQNTYPTPGQTAIDETTILSASGFSVYGTNDTHVKSQWRIRTSNQNWSNPAHDSGETNSLTSYNTPSGILHLGQNHYFFQVRYKGSKLGWSEWSQETEFITDSANADAVGVALVKAGGGAGTWQNIDGNGNNINPNKVFWDNHPIYKNIKDVVIDGQAMVKIPKFYYKVETLKSGDQAGKKAWLISNKPAAGYKVHPAFLDKSKEINQFYVGKYEGTDDLISPGVKIGSAKNKKPLVSQTIVEMQKRCKARNIGGINGFDLWSIYELAAIQFLCLIEIETSDTQSAIGKGHVNSKSSGVNCLTGTTDAVWRGIYELWGNAWHFLSGIKILKDGSIYILNSMNQYEDTNEIAPKSSVTYPLTMSNLIDSIFLPKALTEYMSKGTYPDYYHCNHKADENICFHGGDNNDGMLAGFFTLQINTPDWSHPDIGCRISKK